MTSETLRTAAVVATMQYAKARDAADRAKQRFEAAVNEYFDDTDAKRLEFGGECDDEYTDEDKVSVTRVEKTTLEWFPEKLEKRVPKKVLNQVVKKRYTVNDMQGLVAYLKTCGVDPAVFRRYLTIEKTVDVAAIDRLNQIGEIEVNHISGCYVVHSQKPYLKMTVRKGEGCGNGG